MADVSYEIIIRNETDGSSSGSGGGSHGDGGADSASDITNGLEGLYKTYKQIKNIAPVASALSVAKDIFSWQISLVGRNMGNSLVQKKIDLSMQIANQTLSSVGMLVGGIATLNPVMIFGAISGAISTAIDYAKEAEQISYEKRWESISLGLARERAGASLNRSRV